MTTVRYNVWLQVEDEEEMDHKGIAACFKELPGYIEHSFEDSYED